MKKVYVSGAISGVARQEYKKRFDAAARAVEAQGFKAVNPTRFWVCRWRWLYKVLGYDLTLLYDLWRLSKCAHIYKVPGWHESHGAQVESCWAYHHNIYPLPPRIRASIDGVNENENENEKPSPEVGTECRRHREKAFSQSAKLGRNLQEPLRAERHRNYQKYIRNLCPTACQIVK